MRFVTDEKSEKEYKEFLERHERCNFQQSPEWAKVKSNWKNEVVLAEDKNGKIIGAVSVLIRKIPIFGNIMYSSRGPTCDIHDVAVMKQLTDGIKEVLKYTDLVLLDIKHIDDEKCKELVGVSNKKELEFARYLSDNNIKMWIRQVLVPGYTDDGQDLLKLKNFLSTLKTVEKIQILPYHNMGKYKWEKLGLEYPLEGVREANQEDVDIAKKILGIL